MSKSFARLMSALLVVLLVVSLAACGNQGEKPQGNETPSNETPSNETPSNETPAEVTPARDDLVIYLGGDPPNYNPMLQYDGSQWNLQRQIYNRLWFEKRDGSVKYELAESYSFDEATNTLTINLRKGVKFHNGEELTADDVVYTLNEHKASAYKSENFTTMESAAPGADKYTVVVKLTQPDASVIESIGAVFVVNKAVMEAAGDNYDQPIGTGAYKLVSHKTDDRIELTRFDDYFEGVPSIKNVTYRIFADSTAATMALQAGELDYAPIPVSAYPNVAKDENLTTQEVVSGGVSDVCFNLKRAPFDDIRVREAFSRAVDKEFILESIYENHGEIAKTMITPNALKDMSGIKDYYPYDPDKAAKMIEELGLKGSEFTIYVMEGLESEAAVVQQNLREVGVTINLESMDPNLMIEKAAASDYDLIFMAIGMGDSPLAWEQMFIDGAMLNFPHYDSAEVNSLFGEAKVEASTEKRQEIFNKIFNKIAEDAPYITLIYGTEVIAYNKDLAIDDFSDGTDLPIYGIHWTK